jgi:hypothetical protein
LTEATQICDVPMGGSTFIAVALDKVYTSVDSGATWTTYVNTPIPASLSPSSRSNGKQAGAAYFGGKFHVASGNTILSSVDGVTGWGIATSTATDRLYYLAASGTVAFSGGNFEDSRTVIHTTDGTTWSETASADFSLPDYAVCGVTDDGSSLSMFAGYTLDNTFVGYSTDAFSTVNGGGGPILESGSYPLAIADNGIFIVAVGLAGRAAYTIDLGSTWVQSDITPLGTIDQSALCMVYDGTKFVVGTQDGKIWTSPTGATWTNVSTVWSAGSGYDLSVYCITYSAASGVYLVGGSVGKMATSTDLTTWTNITPISIYDVLAVATSG